MAHVALDIDGTIAAAPQQMQELASSLQAAGHRVSVLTGCASDPLTQQDWDDKANYLNSLGCGSCYDDLTVISHGVKGGLAQAKAQWCASTGVDVLMDNSKDNAKAAAAAGVPLVLVPWATRV
jgi:hypothetical protein